MPDHKRKQAHGPTVHAIKRAKYQAKQERRRLLELQQENRIDASHTLPSFDSSWFDGREEYAIYITADDVRKIRQRRDRDSCNATKCRTKGDCDETKQSDQTCNPLDTGGEVDRLDRIASWIEPFFDLKESPKQQTTDCNGETETNSTRHFIAEGTESVRLMIQKCAKSILNASQNTKPDDEAVSTDESCSHLKSPPVQIISMLCKPATFFDQPVCLLDEVKKCRCIQDDKSCPFKIIVGTDDALSEIVGFPMSRGAMVCGVVPKFNNAFQWMKELVSSSKSERQSTMKKPKRIIALDAISNTSNMGSIIRTAAAFGVDAIILSDDSCDAWYRQSVRVSMGHVVTVPTIRVAELRKGLKINDAGDGGLPAVLRWLSDEMKVQSFAAVVDDDNTIDSESMPPLVSLESITSKQRNSSWVCILGNEGNGIRKKVVKEADYRIRISMTNDDVDSLSLPVAAGILIHGLSSK